MPYPLDRRCSHLASAQVNNRESLYRRTGVEVTTGRDGTVVYRLGHHISAPALPPKQDPTMGLMAELEAQKKARQAKLTNQPTNQE